MNKNFNYDDTLIEPTNNSGDTTQIDTGGTPPPYYGDPQPTEEYEAEEVPQQVERKDSNNKGIIAASAGIALVGGAAAAYGLGAFDSEEDDPNAIADAIAEGEVELSEEPVEVASIEVVTEAGSATVTTTVSVSSPSVTVDTTIGSDDNVRSLSSSITVPESLDEISLTTVTTDDMTFSTAFATARRAVGPHGVFEWRGGVYGTYYENEWKHMPADYKQEFSNHNWRAEMAGMEPGETIINNSYVMGGAEADGNVIIQQHNTVIVEGNVNIGATPADPNSATAGGGSTASAGSCPSAFDYTVDDVMISTAPDDKMSFETAYSVARADVGPGGVFGWRGNAYNTFTKEEWKSLSATSQATFSEYDWMDEIEKAESQGDGWIGIYIDPETGEPLAEIPTDPVTGEPIDDINPHIGYEYYDEEYMYGEAYDVNDSPEDENAEAYAVNDNEEIVFENDIDDNYEYETNDNPENGYLYAQDADYGDEQFDVNDNPENFVSDEGYLTATAVDDVEILNGDDDVYIAEAVDYDYGSPAVIEDDYNVAEFVNDYDEPEEIFDEPEVYEDPVETYEEPALAYEDSYNDNPEPVYDEPCYDEPSYDMPADDYSNDCQVDIDGAC